MSLSQALCISAGKWCTGSSTMQEGITKDSPWDQNAQPPEEVDVRYTSNKIKQG